MTNSPLMLKSPEAWRAWGFPEAPPPPPGSESCYLRFGHLPPGGRSYAYTFDPVTGEQGGYFENGVGVFKAFRTPDDEHLVDLEYKVHLATVYVRTRKRPAYLVGGKVVGHGAAN